MAGPNDTLRLNPLAVDTRPQAAPSARVGVQQSATLVDNTPRYLPRFEDANLEGLVQGLKVLNPILEKYQQDQEKQGQSAGELAASTGQAAPDNPTGAFARGYLRMQSTKSAQEDGASLITAYDTEFDKDTGNLEEFIKDKLAEKTAGLQPGDYLDGYNQALSPILNKLRAGHLQYRRERVVANVESGAMELISNGVGAYTSAGQPVPETYIAEVRKFITGDMKVSNERFNELLFDSLNRHAQEGNYGVFDALKKPNGDGSPGLYFDPKWKAKIDAAEIHAQNIATHKDRQAEEKSKHDRENRQDSALLDVFQTLADGDRDGARQKFDEVRRSGLFQNASELIRWEGHFHQMDNREASTDQMDTENKLLVGVYERRTGIRDILDADLKPQQKNRLIHQIGALKAQDRAEANAADRQERTPQILKLPEYTNYKGLLKHMVVPTQGTGESSLDLAGQGRLHQVQGMAEAEFARRVMESKDPAQIPTIYHEVSKRYQEHANAVIRPNAKPLPSEFTTPQQVAYALRMGVIGMEEAQMYQRHFQQPTKAPTK